MNLVVAYTLCILFQGDIFQVHTEILIDSFRQRTAQDLNFMLSMMRTMIAASGTESGKVFQQLLINNTWFLRRYSPAPTSFDECACSVAFNCPDSMWSGGHFVCYNGNNCTVGSVAWTTPGISFACTAIETILTTDYRCFFDQSCIDMILSLYNYDLPGRLPLPAATMSISAMDDSIPSRFKANDTMSTLINELLIEEWEIRSSFEGYYKSCSPSSCKYTITEYLNIVSIVTTIISLYGGLVIVFSLLIPNLTQFLYFVYTYRSDRDVSINVLISERRMNRMMSWLVYVKGYTKKINLFKRERISSQILQRETLAIIATRLYILLLTGCVSVLVLFNSLYPMSLSITVSKPSVEMFERLQSFYPSTFSCSCKQISVSYSVLFKLAPTYHQVSRMKLTLR